MAGLGLNPSDYSDHHLEDDPIQPKQKIFSEDIEGLIFQYSGVSDKLSKDSFFRVSARKAGNLDHIDIKKSIRIIVDLIRKLDPELTSDNANIVSGLEKLLNNKNDEILNIELVRFQTVGDVLRSLKKILPPLLEKILSDSSGIKNLPVIFDVIDTLPYEELKEKMTREITSVILSQKYPIDLSKFIKSDMLKSYHYAELILNNTDDISKEAIFQQKMNIAETIPDRIVRMKVYDQLVRKLISGNDIRNANLNKIDIITAKIDIDEIRDNLFRDLFITYKNKKLYDRAEKILSAIKNPIIRDEQIIDLIKTLSLEDAPLNKRMELALTILDDHVKAEAIEHLCDYKDYYTDDNYKEILHLIKLLPESLQEKPLLRLATILFEYKNNFHFAIDILEQVPLSLKRHEVILELLTKANEKRIETGNKNIESEYVIKLTNLIRLSKIPAEYRPLIEGLIKQLALYFLPPPITQLKNKILYNNAVKIAEEEIPNQNLRGVVIKSIEIESKKRGYIF